MLRWWARSRAASRQQHPGRYSTRSCVHRLPVRDGRDRRLVVGLDRRAAARPAPPRRPGGSSPTAGRSAPASGRGVAPGGRRGHRSCLEDCEQPHRAALVVGQRGQHRPRVVERLRGGVRRPGAMLAALVDDEGTAMRLLAVLGAAPRSATTCGGTPSTGATSPTRAGLDPPGGVRGAGRAAARGRRRPATTPAPVATARRTRDAWTRCGWSTAGCCCGWPPATSPTTSASTTSPPSCPTSRPARWTPRWRSPGRGSARRRRPAGSRWSRWASAAATSSTTSATST